jgi:hypothetical protein
MQINELVLNSHANAFVATVDRLVSALPRLFVPAFALFFYAFAVCFAVAAAVEFALPILKDGDVLGGLVEGLHTGVVALAVYELAEIVHQEYDTDRRLTDIVARIRRGVARFGAVVIVALMLESLIMVIKYSQQDLAGFLYYPAMIICSAALLIAALGVFTRLTAAPQRADRS